MLVGACASAPAASIRLAEARALARQYTEMHLDGSFATLSKSGVLGDIDCSREIGVDARQCIAFSALMASRLEELKSHEFQATLAEAEDEIEAFAVAISRLPEADVATLQENANLPEGSNANRWISAEGEAILNEPRDALLALLSRWDHGASDKVQALVLEVVTELMNDPTLQ